MKTEQPHPPSEDLFAYRDGELTPEKRAMIEAHVTGCSVCRALVDQVSALEAELRQSPTPSPTGYLDRLSESVRARIAVAASEVGAEAAESSRAGRAAKERAGAELAEPRRAGRFVDSGERSGKAGRLERGRIKEAPKLPWAAVVGTASAAAAVLVVVVILIRQGPYQRMIMPTPAPKSESTTRGGTEGEAKQEQDKVGARDEKKEAPRTVALGTEPSDNKPIPVPSQPPAAATEPPKNEIGKLDANLKDQLAKRSDELAERLQAKNEVSGDKAAFQEAAPEESQARAKAAAPRAMAQKSMISEAGYKAILERFGLPSLWDEQVAPQALSDAEPDLRSFYMSGAAGTDSARVRLYLAEAARLRYAPGDTELYDEIQHHYRRVIETAGSDAEVARVARDRLRSLEK